MHALQLQSAVKWNSFQLFVTASVCAFSAFFLSALFSYIPQTMHIFFCQHTNNQFFLCLFFVLSFLCARSLSRSGFMRTFFFSYIFIHIARLWNENKKKKSSCKATYAIAQCVYIWLLVFFISFLLSLVWRTKNFWKGV